jgi:hypothetical protein
MYIYLINICIHHNLERNVNKEFKIDDSQAHCHRLLQVSLQSVTTFECASFRQFMTVPISLAWLSNSTHPRFKQPTYSSLNLEWLSPDAAIRQARGIHVSMFPILPSVVIFCFPFEDERREWGLQAASTDKERTHNSHTGLATNKPDGPVALWTGISLRSQSYYILTMILGSVPLSIEKSQ